MMNTTKYLYREIASRIIAIENCNKSGNVEWNQKHRDAVRKLVHDYMPSGSGIDNGTKIDLDASTPDRLVFTFGYHHMNESGMYDGWTEHKLIVTPSLAFNYDLKITGRDRNQIKEYLYDVYGSALDSEVEFDADALVA